MTPLTAKQLAKMDEDAAYEAIDKMPEPAPETGGGWRYIENAYSAEIAIDDVADSLRLRAHWTGVADPERLHAVLRQIVSDHRAVPLLIEALQRRVSPTKCYCEVMLGAKCGECNDRELLKSLNATVDIQRLKSDV